jgi:hypothetical protein
VVPGQIVATNTQLVYPNQHGATHNVGYAWTSPDPALYGGTATAYITKYTIASDGILAQKVRKSPEVRDKVIQALRSVKTTAQNLFAQNPGQAQASFRIGLSSGVEFLGHGVEHDLYFAVKRADFEASVDVVVNNDASLSIASLHMDGWLEDLYDFDFEGPGQVFVRPAAIVQTGYGTLSQQAGKVYRYRALLDGDLLGVEGMPTSLGELPE